MHEFLLVFAKHLNAIHFSLVQVVSDEPQLKLMQVGFVSVHFLSSQ